jgi:hypothetical protein
MKPKQGDEGETEANPEGLKLLYQPEPPQGYDVEYVHRLPFTYSFGYLLLLALLPFTD